nr:DoxX family protein [Rhizomicrobium palustre]
MVIKFGRRGKASPWPASSGRRQPAAVWAVAAITLELVGPVPIVWGRFVWLAAGGLTLLTLIASLVAYDFWNSSGQAQFMALTVSSSIWD